MAAARRPWAADILHFWFHELRPSDWFRRNDDIDAKARLRFRHVLEMLGRCRAREFLGNVSEARAAILLFDQFPRNIYRDAARAFTFDPLARAIC